MSPRVPDPDTAVRMGVIAAALRSAGLAAQVNQTQGVPDIAATLDRPGAKPIEVIIDEDLCLGSASGIRQIPLRPSSPPPSAVCWPRSPPGSPRLPD